MHALVTVTAIHDLRTTCNANAAHAGAFCVLVGLGRTTTGSLRRGTHIKRMTRGPCELIRG